MIDIASGEVEDREPPPSLEGKDAAADRSAKWATAKLKTGH